MGKVTEKEIWNLWCGIQDKRPLVHCITNIVTVNDCANIVLAAGASPTMAHHPLEVAEISAGCDCLVCNMGAMENYEAMQIAGKAANSASHPIVIDPVGASGASYRREQTQKLIVQLKPSIIRGNLSEIRALASDRRTQIGVDAAREDLTMSGDFATSITIVKEYAQRTQSIVIASGAVDIISDGTQTCTVSNGSTYMAKITGSGCMESALLGAFLGAGDSFASAVAACTVMGICGELAERKTKEQGGGTMTFRMHLIDAVSTFSERALAGNCKIDGVE
jgi:hydroxyethylthiazole kinase